MEASLLQRLPPELRAQVYELVFSTSEPIRVVPKAAFRYYAKQRCRLRCKAQRCHNRRDCQLYPLPKMPMLLVVGNVSALTQTCRQIRQESSKLFFIRSNFEIGCERFDRNCDPVGFDGGNAGALEIWDSFLDAIGPDNATALKHVAFRTRMDVRRVNSPHFLTCLHRLVVWSKGRTNTRITIKVTLRYMTRLPLPDGSRMRNIPVDIDLSRLHESIAEVVAAVEDSMKQCKPAQNWLRSSVSEIREALASLQQAVSESFGGT